MIDWLVFIAGSMMALGAAFAVLLDRRPAHGARWLVLFLLGLAVLYVQLAAGAVAAIQVFVYAGALALPMRFLFLSLHQDDGQTKIRYFSLSKLLGAVSVVALALLLLRAAVNGAFATASTRNVDASVTAILGLLFVDWLFALKAVGIVVLVVMVGAFGVYRAEATDG